MESKPLLTSGPLLDENGDLVESGYAFDMVKTYQRSAVKKHFHDLNECDYYIFQSRDFAFSLSLSTRRGLTVMAVTLVDFTRNADYEKVLFWPHGPSLFPLSESPMGGDFSYEGEMGENIRVTHEGEGRTLGGFLKDVRPGIDLHFAIDLRKQGQHSLFFCRPLRKKGHFRATNRMADFKANGYVKIGEETYDLSACHGAYSFDRATYKGKSANVWAMVAGDIGEDCFGVNFFQDLGESVKISENAIFLGDDMAKLGPVSIDIPIAENGKDDFMSPWRFRSRESLFQLSFRPIYDLHRRSGGLLSSNEFHQVFGLYEGEIRIGMKVYEFKSVPGFAQKATVKW